jgi:hypothetical protein
MNEPRDLRSILREADPAASVELAPAERARMKAAILSAAPARGARRPARVALQLAGGIAVVVALILTSERVMKPELPSEPATAPPRGSVQSTTRILFTAPEGTQILWFVGSPPATEEES